MPFRIHATVKYTHRNNFRIRACSVENHMAALTEFFVSKLYVVCNFTNLRLASKKREGIVKLFKIVISLLFVRILRTYMVP